MAGKLNPSRPIRRHKVEVYHTFYVKNRRPRGLLSLMRFGGYYFVIETTAAYCANGISSPKASDH